MHPRMDWRALRFDWNHARAFLVSAEEGSFSAAARALGMSQPTVGRQVAALEEELGVTLFVRVGHRLMLTGAGMDLIEHAEAMGEAAARLSLVAAGQAPPVEGRVTICVSELIAAHLLPPALLRLREAHPGVEVEIVAPQTLRELGRREAVIAVRDLRPTQADLVVEKIADRDARLYAAPSYLARLEERVGGPITAEALGQADFFGFDRGEAWIKGLRALGLPVGPENFPIVADSPLVQWEMVKRGLGVAIVMDPVGDAEPAVRRALPDLPPIPAPIWLAVHREVAPRRPLRLVFDLLAEALATGDALPRGAPPRQAAEGPGRG